MLVVVLLLAASAAPPAIAQDGATRAATTITAADVAARVGRLAHDSMRGRETPSVELDRAASYIAGEFARLGLTPAGDPGSFIQRYPLERTVPDTAGSYITMGEGARIRFGTDAIRWYGPYAPNGAGGPAVLLTGSLAAGVERLDLTGAVVVAAVPTDGAGQPAAGTRSLLRAILARNPAAVLLPTDAPDEAWAEFLRQGFRSSLSPAWGDGDEGTPVVLVRDRALVAVLGRAGVDLAVARRMAGAPNVRPLPGLRATVVAKRIAQDGTTAPNVAGLLPGSDPTLRDEVLVISAHMDHVGPGRCRAVGADSICNGADDNASGTTAVLELAEAFASLTPRPKRSVVFLTVSGEERGLWGSDYFARNPPVPVAQIVADLNLDMVGRNWKDTIVAIGRQHSDLGATLDRVQAAHPDLGMTAADDLWPDERFYFRSDHYNFARRGVPILFFFNGTHPDYHGPGDEPAKIDAEKEARVARLVFYLGLEIANARERPKWNPQSYRDIVNVLP
jgi:hypothetical protein